MAGLDVDERRLLFAAELLGERAAGVEAAAGRRIDRAGTSPVRMIRRRCRSTVGSGIGTADSSAFVYGCSGRS